MKRFLTLLIALLLVTPVTSLARHHRKARRASHHSRSAYSSVLPVSFFSPDTLHHGRATYYRHNPRGGSCAFPSPDSMVVAMNGASYANAALCGACVEVEGPRGSVIARVVDRCVGCARGSLDLSKAAFARIAPLAAGRISIDWRVVGCPQDTVMSLHRTAGSSRHWNSLQLRGAGVPVRSLEIQKDSGWIMLDRRASRYVSRSLPELPWTVRLTDVWGRQVIDSLVDPAPGEEVALRVRFPEAPAPASRPWDEDVSFVPALP